MFKLLSKNIPTTLHIFETCTGFVRVCHLAKTLHKPYAVYGIFT